VKIYWVLLLFISDCWHGFDYIRFGFSSAPCRPGFPGRKLKGIEWVSQRSSNLRMGVLPRMQQRCRSDCRRSL
jgi:hypothetical protein